MSDSFGFQRSSDLSEFRLDVWLGLVAAAIIAAAGIVTLAAVWFLGRWSNTLFARLVTAGVFTVLVTFLANLPFHSYWSFMGALLPIGNALFCWLVGAQIWKGDRQPLMTARN